MAYALRRLQLPIRLFGENLADVRDRLRFSLAKIEILKERGGDVVSTGDDVTMTMEEVLKSDAAATQEEAEASAVERAEETQYTHASAELIAARRVIAQYSFEKSRGRLSGEKRRRAAYQKTIEKEKLLANTTTEATDTDTATATAMVTDTEDNSNNDDDIAYHRQEEYCQQMCNGIRSSGISLEGSQYGDGRPLSAITAVLNNNNKALIATGGWSGSIKLWHGESLDLMCTVLMAHEDRIMGIDACTSSNYNGDVMLATSSIDLTAKLWKVTNNVNVDVDVDVNMIDNDDNAETLQCQEVAHLKGHKARLCKVKWHPNGRYVGTTSFDHTWRLWDVETGTQLLLQDGHCKETYGIGMHGDGSLCSTTDFGGVVQVWDLRSGKSVCHFLGHAKRVLCSEFSPNGFQLATAGDDGTLKVWDLRRRKQLCSIPAHSKLIPQLMFQDEYLTSCSFDGTGKVWSTRDWKGLATLRGHEGKVMGMGVLDCYGGVRSSSYSIQSGVDVGRSFVTCGYDKTLKIWR